MLTGLYSAGTAMGAAIRRHEIIAQNLAHAQMPGYRRLVVQEASVESTFHDELQQAVLRESMGSDASTVAVDFTPGIAERTGNPLDVAIEGDGFFVVQGPQGPLYTRNGAFQLDSAGKLVTADQFPVGAGGRDITIPPDTVLRELVIGRDGTVLADGAEIGRIDVVRFRNPQALERVGTTLFAAPDSELPEPADATIAQFARERSNVSPIVELVELVAAQRRLEAAQRAMMLLSESIGNRIDLNGGV